MSDQCDALLERLELFLDGECASDAEQVIEQHLQDCPPCLHRADFERRLRELVATKCRDSAPAGLVDGIMSRLQLS
ncbi:mycothiol system anti-sigma-R factor [Euzebya tangerina]|uniref:mycothiol system anti-sigma-R factor n=1 Tax=Euzebya tangerina TaxID=591198 RepID=UPI000E30DB6D|nr:mycothiol system anti-sigma-R factor [Euzebya tangerina]